MKLNNYCLDKQLNNIDAEAFIDFYESKILLDSNRFKNATMLKIGKLAVRTWERREKDKPQTMSKIDAQLNEYLKDKRINYEITTTRKFR